MAIPPWTTIPDARLLPDAPVRSVDALALRDNVYALAQADEGDATPQVYTDGIADSAITEAKIATGMLLCLCGRYYDETAGAFQYLFQAHRNTGGGGEETLINGVYFYVPSGATTLTVMVYGWADAIAGLDKFLDVTVGAAAEQQITLNDISPKWYTVTFAVADTGSGLLQLTVDTDNNGANPRDFYCGGLIVYVSA